MNRIRKLLYLFYYSLFFTFFIRSVTNDPIKQILIILKHLKIKLIFDVGANTGQFGLQLYSNGYKGKMVSFEPLPDAHKKLQSVASITEGWTVYPRCCLGNKEENVDFNISENSVSSSVLAMLQSHINAAPNSKFIGTIHTPMYKLDNIAKKYELTKFKYFIKIDTQGFEWEVLNGSTETLSNASGCLCELSLTPLYEDQHLWMEIINWFEVKGFTLWAIQNGFINKSTGRTLQIDAIFIRA